MAEEAVEAAPVTATDLSTGEDTFGDEAVSRGKDPAGNDVEEEDSGGLGKEAAELL